jgi:hypothetical protein
MRKVKELVELDNILNEDGIDLFYVDLHEVRMEDIKKIDELKKLRIKCCSNKVRGVKVIDLEDAKKLSEYFDYFGIEHGIYRKTGSLDAIYQYQRGPYARDDTITWYIKEYCSWANESKTDG